MNIEKSNNNQSVRNINLGASVGEFSNAGVQNSPRSSGIRYKQEDGISNDNEKPINERDVRNEARENSENQNGYSTVIVFTEEAESIKGNSDIENQIKALLEKGVGYNEYSTITVSAEDLMKAEDDLTQAFTNNEIDDFVAIQLKQNINKLKHELGKVFFLELFTGMTEFNSKTLEFENNTNFKHNYNKHYKKDSSKRELINHFYWNWSQGKKEDREAIFGNTDVFTPDMLAHMDYLIKKESVTNLDEFIQMMTRTKEEIQYNKKGICEKLWDNKGKVFTTAVQFGILPWLIKNVTETVLDKIPTSNEQTVFNNAKEGENKDNGSSQQSGFESKFFEDMSKLDAGIGGSYVQIGFDGTVFIPSETRVVNEVKQSSELKEEVKAYEKEFDNEKIKNAILDNDWTNATQMIKDAISGGASLDDLNFKAFINININGIFGLQIDSVESFLDMIRDVILFYAGNGKEPKFSDFNDLFKLSMNSMVLNGRNIHVPYHYAEELRDMLRAVIPDLMKMKGVRFADFKIFFEMILDRLDWYEGSRDLDYDFGTVRAVLEASAPSLIELEGTTFSDFQDIIDRLVSVKTRDGHSFIFSEDKNTSWFLRMLDQWMPGLKKGSKGSDFNELLKMIEDKSGGNVGCKSCYGFFLHLADALMELSDEDLHHKKVEFLNIILKFRDIGVEYRTFCSDIYKKLFPNLGDSEFLNLLIDNKRFSLIASYLKVGTLTDLSAGKFIIEQVMDAGASLSEIEAMEPYSKLAIYSYQNKLLGMKLLRMLSNVSMPEPYSDSWGGLLIFVVFAFVIYELHNRWSRRQQQILIQQQQLLIQQQQVGQEQQVVLSAFDEEIKDFVSGVNEYKVGCIEDKPTKPILLYRRYLMNKHFIEMIDNGINKANDRISQLIEGISKDKNTLDNLIKGVFGKWNEFFDKAFDVVEFAITISEKEKEANEEIKRLSQFIVDKIQERQEMNDDKRIVKLKKEVEDGISNIQHFIDMTRYESLLTKPDCYNPFK